MPERSVYPSAAARRITASLPSSGTPETRLGPPTIGEPPRRRRKIGRSMKRADDSSLKVTVEWAAGDRANGRQSSRAVEGIPQLTTMRLCFGEENSNDRQPA